MPEDHSNNSKRSLRHKTIAASEASQKRAQEAAEIAEERKKQARKRAQAGHELIAKQMALAEAKEEARYNRYMAAQCSTSATEAILEACRLIVDERVGFSTDGIKQEVDENIPNTFTAIVNAFKRALNAPDDLQIDSLQFDMFKQHLPMENQEATECVRQADEQLGRIDTDNGGCDILLEPTLPEASGSAGELHDNPMEWEDRSARKRQSSPEEEHVARKRARIIEQFVLFAATSGKPTVDYLVKNLKVLVYNEFEASSITELDLSPVSDEVYLIQFGASGNLRESLKVLLNEGETPYLTLRTLNEVEYGDEVCQYLHLFGCLTPMQVGLAAFLVVLHRIIDCKDIYVDKDAYILNDKSRLTLQSIVTKHTEEARKALELISKEVKDNLERVDVWMALQWPQLPIEMGPAISNTSLQPTLSDLEGDAATKNQPNENRTDSYEKMIEFIAEESVFKRHFSRELFETLKSKKSKNGVMLEDCIKKSKIGFWAPDADSYKKFSQLFNVVIEDFYSAPLPFRQPQSCFEVAGMKLKLEDPRGDYVKYTRIVCTRNIKSHRFVPQLGENELSAIEKEMKHVFDSFKGVILGKYYSKKDVPEDLQRLLLRKQDLWMDEDEPAFNSSSTGQGIFVNEKRKLFIFVNGKDHLRIVAEQEGADFGSLLLLLGKAVYAMRKKVPFIKHDQLGWLTTNPANLGPAVTASAIVRLPKTSQKPRFSELCSQLHLEEFRLPAEQSETFGADAFKVINKPRLGVSEVETVCIMHDAVKALIAIEKAD